MLELLRRTAQFTLGIYIFLGLFAIFFIRQIWIARRDQTRSIFSMEREDASSKITNGFIGLMVIFGIILGVFYLNATIPQIAPPPANTPTATPVIEIPPTPTSPILLPTPTPTSTPTTTIPLTTSATSEFTTFSTPQLVPVATLPTSSLGQPPNCPIIGNRIVQPGNGAQVAGMVQIYGSAMGDNFDYYKFEFRVPNGNWAFIQNYHVAVSDGVLGFWNSDTVPPGEYEFRLLVVDTTGNYPEPCTVRLIVQ